MALKCVPLVAGMTGDTKHDLRAIYRKPNGDLSAGLPMRRHQQWLNKGFEYVTLADADSLVTAAPLLQAAGLNPQDYVAGREDGRPTPWNVAAYLVDDKARIARDEAELKAKIDKYGVDTVESILGLKVPDHLRPVTVAKASKAVA